MVIRIHNPKHSVGKNAGSVSNLVEYLEKENAGKKEWEAEEFFNRDGELHTALEVEKSIDGNKGKLAKDETKFYMLSVSPSQTELDYLMLKYTKEDYEHAFKDYIKDLMDQYAENFNREFKDGRPLTGDDILYYAKIEHERTYKHGEKRFENEMVHNRNIERKLYAINKDADQIKDPKQKVKTLAQIKELENKYIRNSKGTIIKEGAKKDGNNLHAHIIVSRMDKSQSLKLSPMANHKQSKNKLNGKEVTIGFNRDDFVASGERLFDQKFAYDRSPQQSYNYYKVTKHIRTVGNLLHMTNPKAFAKVVAKRAINEMIKDKTLQKKLGYVVKDPRQIPNGMMHKLEGKAIETVVKAMGAGAYTNPVTAGVQVAKQAITIAAKTVSKGMGI